MDRDEGLDERLPCPLSGSGDGEPGGGGKDYTKKSPEVRYLARCTRHHR